MFWWMMLLAPITIYLALLLSGALSPNPWWKEDDDD